MWEPGEPHTLSAPPRPAGGAETPGLSRPQSVFPLVREGGRPAASPRGDTVASWPWLPFLSGGVHCGVRTVTEKEPFWLKGVKNGSSCQTRQNHLEICFKSVADHPCKAKPVLPGPLKLSE